MRKRAAVLGFPIKHSLSPAIHNAAYLALGIEGKYDAVEVQSGQLSNFMDVVKSTEANWIGFSVTMPLKEELLQVADEIDPLAKQINSANTLIPTSTGWKAFSTDVSGFIWALSFNGISEFKTIQILGSGATSRAAAAAVDARGRKIEIIARDTKRMNLMEQTVLDSELNFIPWGQAKLDAELVINTTPKGAADDLNPGAGFYFDAVYDPWPTVLASKWQGNVLSGLELLIHQAVDQIHLMTGFIVDRKSMVPILKTAAEAELKSRE